MARQFENTLDRFAVRTSTVSTVNVVGLSLAIVMIAGLVVSAAYAVWAAFVLFLIGLAGVAALAVSATQHQRRSRASGASSWIAWSSSLPEVQKQNLTIAARELSRNLGSGTGSLNDILSAFIVSEDLALREIQREEGVPVMRHVGIGGVPFDAAFFKDDALTCIEAFFLVAPELRQERVLAMVRKIAAVRKSIEVMNIGLDVRLMALIVTQMGESDVAELRSTLSTGRFASTPVDIDIRLFDFDDLQRIYVTDL